MGQYASSTVRELWRRARSHSLTSPNGFSVLVNGVAGVVSRLPGGNVFSVVTFTVKGNRIVEIDVIRDPDRLQPLNLAAFEAGKVREE
jgi:hypothetical protein